MLSFFRKTLTSLPVLILLGVLLIAFAITGVGDPFGSKTAPQGSVARVGDRIITEQDLTRQFDRILRRQQETNPQLSRAQVAREGGVQLVADQLVTQTAIEQFARRIGLAASDRLVGGEIGSIPAFQANGKFNDAAYKRALDNNRISDRELRDGIVGDLLRRQLLEPLVTQMQAPAGIATPYARLLLDIHKGEAAVMPLGTPVPATDAEILAYYTANKARFTLPERRSFRYAAIDRATLAAKVQPTEADIAAAFAASPEKYGAAPTRKLQQVVVADAAKAKAIADAARTEGFEKAAVRLAGVQAADLDIGEQSEKQFATATSADVAKAAFSLPAGGISQPVKSDFGYHIVRVAALGQAGKSLAQARPAIAAELAKAASDKAVRELVNKIEDGLEGGKSFADLAKENQLAIQTAGPVTKDGKLASGATVAAELLPVVAKAFGHDPADGAVVDDLGDGRLVVVETTAVSPPAPQPLAEISAVIASAATQEKALKAGKARADAVIAAVKAGKSFATALAAQGVTDVKPVAGRRADLGNKPPPPAARLLLDTPVGGVGAVPGDQGWLLVHVTAIEPGDLAAVPQLLQSARVSLGTQANEELAAAFAQAAVQAIKAERNAATVNTVARRMAGEDTTQ